MRQHTAGVAAGLFILLLNFTLCAASPHGFRPRGSQAGVYPPVAAPLSDTAHNARKLLTSSDTGATTIPSSPPPRPSAATGTEHVPQVSGAMQSTGTGLCDSWHCSAQCTLGCSGRKLQQLSTAGGGVPANFDSLLGDSSLPTGVATPLVCEPEFSSASNVMAAAYYGMNALNGRPALLMEVFKTQTPLVLQSVTSAQYCGAGFNVYLLDVKAMLPTGSYAGHAYGTQLSFSMTVAWNNGPTALLSVVHNDQIYDALSLTPPPARKLSAQTPTHTPSPSPAPALISTVGPCNGHKLCPPPARKLSAQAPAPSPSTEHGSKVSGAQMVLCSAHDCNQYCREGCVLGRKMRRLSSGSLGFGTTRIDTIPCPYVSTTDGHVIDAAQRSMETINSLPNMLLDVFKTDKQLVLQSITSAQQCDWIVTATSTAYTYVINVQAMLPTGTMNGNVYGTQVSFSMSVNALFGTPSLESITYKNILYAVVKYQLQPVQTAPIPPMP